MKFRRGFKSEANRIARELRQELGLRVTAPLDPWKLAKHLGVVITPLSAFAREAKDAVIQLTERDPSSFSAGTICRGSRRFVVVNDAHHPHRQASSLAHELAHVLLWHTPAQAFHRSGAREWNAEQEAEANWLGAALLISDEAAVQIARTGQSSLDAATGFGVSEEMVEFRIRVTGAYTRATRMAVYRSAGERPRPTG